MKKVILISAAIIACFLLHTAYCFPQGAAINTTGNPADPSAGLDVSFSNKGFLMPRLSTTQRNGISNPATGLQIYNTDIKCIEMWDGSAWKSACGSQSGGGMGSYPCYTTSGTASANPTTGNCTGYTCTLTLTGYSGNIQWQQSTDNIYFYDIPGATSAVSNVTVQGSPMYYTAKVTQGSCATTFSNVITVTATGCLPFSCNTIGWTGAEQAQSIIQLAGGGFAIAGQCNTCGAGDLDMYVVKTDATGHIIWTRTIGGAGVDAATDIIETSDKGFAVAGITNSYGAGDFDMYISRLDSSGNLQWAKTAGGSGSDQANAVVQTADGGFILAGLTGSFGTNTDVYIAKFDGSGNLSITKTYGGSSSDIANAIIRTNDGGYAISGNTSSAGFGQDDALVIKLASDYSVSWVSVVGGSKWDWGQNIFQNATGEYYIGGSTQSPTSTKWDAYEFKLDAGGGLSWCKYYGSTGNDVGFNCSKTTGNGMILTGYTDFSGMYKLLMVKTDASGNLSWASSADQDYAYDVIQCSDGSFIAAGFTQGTYSFGNKDFYIVRADGSGLGCCTGNLSFSSGTFGSKTSLSLNITTNNGTSASGGLVGTCGTKKIICD